MFDKQTIQQLDAPLDSRANKRLPTSRNEPYLEGWFVAEQANKLFGDGNWSRELIADSLKCVDETQHVAPKTGELLPFWDVTYIATVKVTVREKGDNFPSYSAEHTGTGGSTTNKAPRGEAHIRAAKAAETDAMKRALAFGFGNQFGLACYAGDSHMVDVAAAMNRLKTLAHEMQAPMPNVTNVPELLEAIDALQSQQQSIPSGTVVEPNGEEAMASVDAGHEDREQYESERVSQ